MYKTMKEIMKRINKIHFGAYTTSDFLDLAKYKTVSKSLELLEDEGYLKKAKRGVYYKPQFIATLGIETFPSLDDIASAIARQYNWEIIPTGNSALNLIGISTQVPAKTIYISNGPYREYKVGNNSITLKHSTTKEIYSIRRKNLIAIQAIKELGKDGINESEIKLINMFLDKDDKKEIIKGIKTTTWIYEKLRRIACIQ